MDQKNGVACLTNPATKHVEYLPLESIKLAFKGKTTTLKAFYEEYLALKESFNALQTQLNETKEEQKKQFDKQAQINELLTNSIKLINEKLSIVETDIETLNNLK